MTCFLLCLASFLFQYVFKSIHAAACLCASVLFVAAYYSTAWLDHHLLWIHLHPVSIGLSPPTGCCEQSCLVSLYTVVYRCLPLLFPGPGYGDLIAQPAE